MTDYRLPPTMNLWLADENASMMEALMSSDMTSSFWANLTPTPAPVPPSSSSALTSTDPTKTLIQSQPFNQESLQQRLQALISTDPTKTLLQSHPFNQESLQQRLQALIKDARESWTYAIFWQSSVVNYTGPSLLGWGDGYYKGEENKDKRINLATTASIAEQEHRKKVLRELDSLIFGSQVPESDAVDEEVTDTEWFFLVSMTQSFVNGSGLLGQAFYNFAPVWVTGRDRLAQSH